MPLHFSQKLPEKAKNSLSFSTISIILFSKHPPQNHHISRAIQAHLQRYPHPSLKQTSTPYHNKKNVTTPPQSQNRRTPRRQVDVPCRLKSCGRRAKQENTRGAMQMHRSPRVDRRILYCSNVSSSPATLTVTGFSWSISPLMMRLLSSLSSLS